jgi:uncharacterized RDD family membrane protein YckC
MKIIEIKTTQNVVLQYELADLRERILAFVIDFISVSFGLGILLAVLGSVFSGVAANILLVLILCVFIFYSLAFEVLNNGQSLGKMAMRIQVIKTTHGSPTFADYAGRWVFRLVDIYFSLGGIACILIASSTKSQRIGDIVANTAVVKLTPEMNLDLKDILTLHAQTAYKPQFVQAKQLLESDVLLIKSTLQRSNRYANNAHAEALTMLAAKISTVLRLERVPMDDRRFLETVLKDYVMLTR